MANTLLIKGSKTSTATPSLSYGADDGDGDASTEIAINRADGKLFYMDDSNQVTEFVSTSSGNATTFTVTANNSTNETIFPLFVDGATGSQGAETDTGFTYNPSSGTLTATAFVGDGSGITGLSSGATNLTGLSDVTYANGDLTITSLDKIISGALMFDCSGDMTIDVDGGNLHIHDATKKQFEFDCDNTTFKIYDEAPSNAHSDYAYLKTVSTASPTEIKQFEIGIVDASGSVETKPSGTINDILITAPEDIMLNAGSGEIQFHEAGVEIAAMANPSTNVHIMSMGGTAANVANAVGIRYNAGEMEYRNSDHGSSTWTPFDDSFDAGNLSSGTVPDGRFPGTLPAMSGVNLTALNASNVASGTLPVARAPAMVGAVNATNAAGIPGVVPTPSGTQEFNVLTGGGTYVENKDSTYSIAAVAGSSAILRMSAAGTSSGDDDITFAEAGGMTITRTDANTITFTSADTNTQLSTEAVQDIVGAMFTSNTETRIAATYEDGDGTIDLVVTDMTANDNTWRTVTAGGNTLSTSETLAFTAGTNVTITESAGAVTITSADTNTTYSSSDFTHDDLTGFVAAEHVDWAGSSAGTIHASNYTDTTTNTMGSGFVMEDGDGTEVTITENKEVKFVEGTGIDIDWTDTSTGSDGDPYDLTFTNTGVTSAVAGDGIDVSGATGAVTITAETATASNPGIVELATTGETTTGSDTARAVTPAGVQAAIDALVDSAPGALDTLNELAAAIGDDASYATTVTNALAAKAAIAGPTFTGIVTTPDLTLTDLANQGSEATAVVINGSNVVGTRELAANAFTSTTIPTNNNQLTNGAGYITATLTTEAVQDIVGAMFTSNTETRIAATYEDGDGTIDLVVTDMTANDNTWRTVTAGGNTLSTSETLAFTAGTNIAITESGGAVTITGTDTNTTYTGGTNLTLSGTTFNVDDAFLKNDASDTTSGTITAAGFTTTGTWTFDEYTSGTIGITTVQDSGTTFNDNDTSFMTAAAINDRIGTIAGGGEANQNAWTTITVPSGTTTQVADTTTDTLEFTAAGGMTITGGADDTIQFSSSDTNTWRTVTAGGNTLSTSETLAFTAGTNVTITESGGAVTITSADTNTQLSTEAVQDIVGAMFTSNTETRIAATYEDGDGTIDLVVTDMTANDNTWRTVTAGGNTLSTSETLAFTAGTGITIAESAGAVTITNSIADTTLSTEQVQDIVGAMFTSNTETRVAATYQDGDGTIDLVVDDMTANDNTQLSTEQVQDIVGAMMVGTETRIGVSYDDTNGEIDFVVDDMTANDNTWRTVTAGGNTLSTSETLAFTAGSNVTITESAGAVTIASTDTNTDTKWSGGSTGLTASTGRTSLGLGALAVLDSVAAGQIDANAVDSSELKDGSIDESHLSATNSPTDNYILSYDSGSSGFTWIAAGAGGENNEDSFKTISVSGQSDVVADSSTDTLTFAAAGGMTITTAAGSDTITLSSADTNTQLSTEQVQDIVGAMFTSNTETRGSLTYQDGDGTIDLVVDDMTANDNTWRTVTAGGNTLSTSETLAFTAGTGITISESAGAVTITNSVSDTTLSTENVQDIVGAMFTSNTETRIAATYEDGDGTIDLVVTDMTANDNTWRTVTAGGNTLSTSETLAFTAGSNVTITESAGAVTIASTDTNTTYSAGAGISIAGGGNAIIVSDEYIQDLVGAMFTSNTETRGSLTYQDGDGTIDLVVDDMSGGGGGNADTITVADSSSTTTFPVFVDTATGPQAILSDSQLTYNASSGTLTSTALSTGSTTGTVTGTASLAIGLKNARTIAGVSFDGTANISLNNNAITNGAGYITSYTNTVDMGDGFVIEDGDGTEVTITENKEVKFVEGTGIDINWTDTSTGSDGDPYDLTFTNTGVTSNVAGNAITVSGATGAVTINHADTSSQASVDNSGTTAIQDITLDAYGHVTGITSADVGGGGGGGVNVGTGPLNDRIAIWEGSDSIGGQSNATISSGGNLVVGGTITDGTDQVMSAFALDQGAAIHGLANSGFGSGVLTLAYAAGPSDERLKREISTIEYGLNEIKAITPKWFKYNETTYNASGLTLPIPTDHEHKDAYYNEQRTGFMAADVKAVMPKLVSLMEDDKDYETYDKDALIFVLVNAVKELEARIVTLEEA